LIIIIFYNREATIELKVGENNSFDKYKIKKREFKSKQYKLDLKQCKALISAILLKQKEKSHYGRLSFTKEDKKSEGFLSKIRKQKVRKQNNEVIMNRPLEKGDSRRRRQGGFSRVL